MEIISPTKVFVLPDGHDAVAHPVTAQKSLNLFCPLMMAVQADLV